MASKKPAPKKKPAEPAPRPSRKAKPKKLGRPPKKPSERRVHTLGVRLTLADKEAIDAEAAVAGMSTAEFVLAALEHYRASKKS
ncbi:MAG: ribbon-helix-helix protein, CopG family [Myxococcales bacterium]|nr:ribbon-helix-helix protein, CopG family [Myxococcales bacterium]